MALATLSIDLVAKIASFEADLKKASTAAEASGQRMAQAFGLARNALLGLGSALSVDLVAQFVTRTVNGIDALNDLADATGSTVEKLSSLEDTARRTGTSVETAGDAVIKLNKSLSTATVDSNTARALAAIGLSVKDLRAQDPVDALQAVAAALSKYADGNSKAAVVQELFGKSLKQVAPLLNDLATVGLRAATVTSEQAKEAEKFNQQLAAISKNSEDAARSLVGKFLPGLNEVLVAVANLGKVKWTDILGESASGNTFTDAGKAVDFYVQKLTELNQQRNIIAQDKNPIARRGGLTDIDAEIAKAQRLLEFYSAIAPARQGAFRASQNYGDTAKPTVKDFKVDPELKRAQEEYRKLAEAIGLAGTAASEEIASGDKLSGLQQLRIKTLQALASGEYAFTEAQRQSIKAAADSLLLLDGDLKLRKTQQEVQAQSIKLSNDLATSLEREAVARAAGNEDLRQQVQEFGKTASAIERLRIARLEDAAVQEQLTILGLQNIEGTEQETAARERNLAVLQQQIKLRRILLNQADEARTSAGEGAQRAVDAYLQRVADAGTATEEVVGRAIGTLEDSLTTALSGGKLSVRSFVDSILQEVIRLQVVKPLLASIFQMGQGGSGSFLAGLGALFGQGNTGTGAGLANSYGGAYANGGFLGAGKWGIAGENGPEPIVGPAHVISNKQTAQTPASQYTVVVQGDASENTVRLIQQAMAQFEARRARG